MSSREFLFSVPHLLILASIPAAAWALARWLRRKPSVAMPVRRALGVALIANELIWYIWRYSTEGFRFPEGLPLQLCDVLVWAAAAACLTHAQWAFEFAYFAGLSGAGMAILTPDLWSPWPSYPAIYYVVVHGLILISTLMLLWSRQARPLPGALKRVFIAINIFAAAVGAFNAVFSTNYMYLCRKPASASALDWMGPWPIYIAVGELAAVAMFALLYLPFRSAHHPSAY